MFSAPAPAMCPLLSSHHARCFSCQVKAGQVDEHDRLVGSNRDKDRLILDRDQAVTRLEATVWELQGAIQGYSRAILGLFQGCFRAIPVADPTSQGGSLREKRMCGSYLGDSPPKRRGSYS